MQSQMIHHTIIISFCAAPIAIAAAPLEHWLQFGAAGLVGAMFVLYMRHTEAADKRRSEEYQKNLEVTLRTHEVVTGKITETMDCAVASIGEQNHMIVKKFDEVKESIADGTESQLEFLKAIHSNG